METVLFLLFSKNKYLAFEKGSPVKCHCFWNSNIVHESKTEKKKKTQNGTFFFCCLHCVTMNEALWHTKRLFFLFLLKMANKRFKSWSFKSWVCLNGAAAFLYLPVLVQKKKVKKNLLNWFLHLLLLQQHISKEGASISQHFKKNKKTKTNKQQSYLKPCLCSFSSSIVFFHLSVPPFLFLFSSHEATNCASFFSQMQKTKFKRFLMKNETLKISNFGKRSAQKKRFFQKRSEKEVVDLFFS